MKRIFLTLVMTGLISSVSSQIGIDSVLSEIEKNNTSLLALRKNKEALKIGNRTDLFLQNPEVEFNYLWGNPSAIGTRTDIKVVQAFDFPSAYSFRNRIAEAKDDQTEISYQSQLRSILLQAGMLCADLENIIKLEKEYEKRVSNADAIASSYKAKFEKGETGIIEYNKARMNLLNLQKEAERNKIEKNTIIETLTGLNGGIPLNINDIEFLVYEVPADFDEWYKLAEQSNPVLAWLRKEAEISLLNEKLVTASSLPKVKTGYMSEKVVGEQFQGITAGISIPLWENKNRLKYARANSLAIQSAEADGKLVFYNKLKTQHQRAVELQNLVFDYRNSLKTFDNAALLEKALNKGEIALAEYFYEISINYESIDKLFDSEWELSKTLAELSQYVR